VTVQPRRLDVEKAGPVGKRLVEAPPRPGREAVREEGSVVGRQRALAPVDERPDAVGAGRPDTPAVRVERLPVGDPLLPESALDCLADALCPQKAVLDVHT
jgi:hypothetical protein